MWAVWRLPALPPLTRGRGGRAGAKWPRASATSRLHKVLLLSFLADIVAMVFGMPRALFPQLAATRTHHRGGARARPAVRRVPLGAVVGGLLSGTFSRARRHGRWSSPRWPPGAPPSRVRTEPQPLGAVGFLALAGVADMVSMVFRGAILLSVATDEMRGRMQGVFTVVVAGGPRVADLLHGMAGSLFGARAAVTGGGLLVIVAVLALAWVTPALRRYTI